MTDRTAPQSGWFILSAFDREQWCPVLETRFQVPDIEVIRKVLGTEANDDPDFWHRSYWLEPDELAAVITAFNVRFDPGRLETGDPDACLFRMRALSSVPYLVHTGYELPLLLEGRKKLARMGNEYPPMTFDGEDRFDHWVAQGKLHREEVIEPFDKPIRHYLGYRTVYDTLKGEEWRIPTMKLIWEAFPNSGGWNEHFERLEGMLFGYEKWENDWWIKERSHRGGFGGTALCGTVNAAGLAWLEAVGFRALPPIATSTLPVILYWYVRDNADDLRAFMLSAPDSVALVHFVARARYVAELLGLPRTDPLEIRNDRIPGLNRELRGPVTILARREDGGRTAGGAGDVRFSV
jgi:hypothetical protein